MSWKLTSMATFYPVIWISPKKQEPPSYMVLLLLRDESGKVVALFSGDTFFFGDVGRSDLAQKADLTLNELSGHLYDSLRKKIMPLKPTTMLKKKQ